MNTLKKLVSKKSSAVVAAVLAVTAAATTFAVAAIPGKGGVITGCYSKKTGDLRVVSSAAKCHKGEKALQWNEKGQRGAKGATGAKGAAGKTGAPGTNGTPGTDGTSMLNGTGAPSDSFGSNGDFYIDTAASTIYGPKASGTWPTPGTSLVGPKGDPGTEPATMLTSASGSAAVVTTTAAGTSGDDVLIPISGVGVVNDVPDAAKIDPSTLDPDPAEIFPRDGTVTGLSAQFTTSVTTTIVPDSVTLSAELWKAPSGSDALSPVAATGCALSPSLTGVVPVGTILTCQVSGLAIPVTAGMNAAIVLTASSPLGITANSIAGHASAGITVS